MSATASSRVRPSFSTRMKGAPARIGGAADEAPSAASGTTIGPAGAIGRLAAVAGKGARASGTSDRRKAPETPKETTVASSASVLRDSADSAPTKRDVSKHK